MGRLSLTIVLVRVLPSSLTRTEQDLTPFGMGSRESHLCQLADHLGQGGGGGGNIGVLRR
jgi:hypothetical protein